MDKIDFVITWVDGTDDNWLKEKKKYKPDSSNDNRAVRYRDLDTLKYWFRAVEKNASWVNKIYFVTWGHVPEWLDTSNEKLVVVKHSDFIPERFLPTFSSCAIEMNLFRINGLSENFVYFNDDMFILNKTDAKDFFEKDLPKDTAIATALVPSGKDMFEHRIVNNINVINKYFKMREVIKKHPLKWFNYKYGFEQIRTLLLLGWSNFPAIKYSHLPASLKKSTFNELWNLEPKVMENTSIQKFRNITSVNPWLIQEWQMVKGKFIPRKANFGKFMVLSDNTEEVKKIILKSKYRLLCINDSSTIEDIEKVKRVVCDCFEAKFSEKSSFEK